MVADLVIQVVVSGIGALLGLLPETGDTGLDQQASAAAVSYGAMANSWFPVTVAVYVLLALLVLELALLGWDFIVWVYHQIWGSN